MPKKIAAIKPIDLEDCARSAEDIKDDILPKTALLIRLASAEQLGDRSGTMPKIDHEAWWGIERMLHDFEDPAVVVRVPSFFSFQRPPSEAFLQ